MRSDGICTSCRMPVRWAVHQLTGSRVPLDPHAVDDGNIGVVDWRDNGNGTHTPIVAVNPDQTVTQYRYVTHFATCPAADHHRRAQTSPVAPGSTNVDHPCPTCQGTGRIDTQTYTRMLDDKPGATRHDSPSTSRRAANVDAGRLGSQRRRVLYRLDTHGPQTAYAIATWLAMSPNQVATRLGELRDDGLVEYVRDETGEIIEAPTTNGNTGRVQQITQTGRDALDRTEGAHHEQP